MYPVGFVYFDSVVVAALNRIHPFGIIYTCKLRLLGEREEKDLILSRTIFVNLFTKKGSVFSVCDLSSLCPREETAIPITNIIAIVETTAANLNAENVLGYKQRQDELKKIIQSNL